MNLLKLLHDHDHVILLYVVSSYILLPTVQGDESGMRISFFRQRLRFRAVKQLVQVINGGPGIQPDLPDLQPHNLCMNLVLSQRITAAQFNEASSRQLSTYTLHVYFLI